MKITYGIQLPIAIGTIELILQQDSIILRHPILLTILLEGNQESKQNLMFFSLFTYIMDVILKKKFCLHPEVALVEQFTAMK